MTAISPFQMAKAIRHEARNAVWPDSPGGLILGASVYITAGVRDEEWKPARIPFGLINLAAQSADDDEPNLLTQEYVFVLAAQVLGDPLGEHSIIGGPSGQGADRFGRSHGRGLLELETGLLTAIGRLHGSDGTPIIVSFGSAPAPERVGDNIHLVHRQYILKAVCTRADGYAPPQNLTVGVATAGQADLAWSLPPATYGTRQMVARYLSGSTAPASASAGTAITLGSDLATSVSVTGLAGGTYSFAIFMGYTETGAASNEKFSPQVTGTTRTAVVA